MRKWFVVLVVAVVLFAALAQAQTQAPAPVIREQYIEARIGQLTAEDNLIQQDLNILIRKYPRVFGDKGTVRKELEAMWLKMLKDDQVEIEKLGKELADIQAKSK
jgi:hypothetical protein